MEDAMMRAAANALGLLLLVPAAALAAGPEPVVGARIRVTAPSVSRKFFGGSRMPLVGTLLSADDKALTIKVGGYKDPAVVPLSSLQRLEASRRRGERGKGFLLGFLVGTGISAIATIGKGSSLCNSTGLSRCDLVFGAITFGLPAGTIGALVASGEEWEEVSIGRMGLRVAPTKGRGVAAALTVSF
jgi:hypothetical protein